MRFGIVATMAALAATSSGAVVSGPFTHHPPNVDNAPLPSVAKRPARGGGMNAHQLARLSAKNARRRR